jgi:hypothetical protein
MPDDKISELKERLNGMPMWGRLSIIDEELGELRATLPPTSQHRIKKIQAVVESIATDLHVRLCRLEGREPDDDC